MCHPKKVSLRKQNIFLVQVGVEGKAFEAILKKVFGPDGLLKEILKGNVSLRDLLKPLKKIKMGGVEKKIEELLRKVI